MIQTLDAAGDRAARTRLDRPPKVDMATHFREANAAAGSPAWIGKLIAAIRSPYGLTVDEFFYYRLYRPEVSAADCRLFVGKKGQRPLHMACNDTGWFAASHDKALFYTIMQGAGLPVPETIALLARAPRHGFPATVSSREELGELLAGRDDFPLFAKPVDGIYSIGSLKILGFHDGTARLEGHADTPLAELYQYMVDSSDSGYLIQRTLAPEPALAEVTGEAIASVRVLVLLSDRPQVASAVIKVPSSDNIADNFWRPGNALGAVDHTNGEITRVIVSRPDGHPPADPEDGRLTRLVGTTVPHWERVFALAAEAASVFPRVRTQSWDVALAREGPTLMEFNFGGDLNLHQLAHGRGALTPDYVAHVRSCGYKRRLP